MLTRDEAYIRAVRDGVHVRPVAKDGDAPAFGWNGRRFHPIEGEFERETLPEYPEWQVVDDEACQRAGALATTAANLGRQCRRAQAMESVLLSFLGNAEDRRVTLMEDAIETRAAAARLRQELDDALRQLDRIQDGDTAHTCAVCGCHFRLERGTWVGEMPRAEQESRGAGEPESPAEDTDAPEPVEYEIDAPRAAEPDAEASALSYFLNGLARTVTRVSPVAISAMRGDLAGVVLPLAARLLETADGILTTEPTEDTENGE